MQVFHKLQLSERIWAPTDALPLPQGSGCHTERSHDCVRAIARAGRPKALTPHRNPLRR